MVFVLGAVSSALDALKSLTSSKSSSPQTSGFSQDQGNSFDFSAGASASPSLTPPVSGSSGLSQLSPSTLSALFTAQGQSSTASASSSPASALQNLFSKLDANGDGQISKSEFENALGAGGTNIANADNVFNKLDKNGDGSVSLGELASGLKGAGGKGHHHHGHVESSGDSGDSSSAAGSSGAGGSSSDPLLQALQASSGKSVTNSNGSTTTTLTNADGSQVSLTSPAAASASNTATSSYNLIQQYLQNEAQSLSSSATNSLAVSV